MAEIDAVEVDTKARKRKSNFSINVIAIITENVENNVTNKNKNEFCEDITRAVNAVGLSSRTVTEVKDKWKNLHKKEFSSFRRESRMTGGGPAPKPPSVASEKNH